MTPMRVLSGRLEVGEDARVSVPCCGLVLHGRGRSICCGSASSPELDRQVAAGRDGIRVTEPLVHHRRTHLHPERVRSDMPQYAPMLRSCRRVRRRTGRAWACLSGVAQADARRRSAVPITEQRIGVRCRAHGLAKLGLRRLHCLGLQLAPTALPWRFPTQDPVFRVALQCA